MNNCNVTKKSKVPYSSGVIFHVYNDSNMKDEKVLRSIIRDLSKITGKTVSLEKEQKIIDTIKNDKVPKNVDKFF